MNLGAPVESSGNKNKPLGGSSSSPVSETPSVTAQIDDVNQPKKTGFPDLNVVGFGSSNMQSNELNSSDNKSSLSLGSTVVPGPSANGHTSAAKSSKTPQISPRLVRQSPKRKSS